HPFFFGRDGAGHRRSYVPYDYHQVGRMILELLLKSDHYGSGLFSLAPSAAIEVGIRSRYIEFFKKGFTHFVIVVLSGMHQTVTDLFPFHPGLLNGMDD